MFPGQEVNNSTHRLSSSVQKWNRRTLNKQRLPPLENIDDNGAAEVRMSTFYQTPIGEENFQIKHMEVKPSQVSSSVEDRLVIRAPSDVA